MIARKAGGERERIGVQDVHMVNPPVAHQVVDGNGRREIEVGGAPEMITKGTELKQMARGNAPPAPPQYQENLK